LELVLDEFPVRPQTVIEDELYAATKEELTSRLRRLEEGIINVLLIGHNPGLHELAIALADRNSANFCMLETGKFPTAARASFHITDPWSALGCSHYDLVGYVTAESLRRAND
jgi:phosphohistidine phosphatase